MEIIWSDPAILNLKDIAEYVSDNFGDSVSLKSIRKIMKKVEGLKRFPESGVLDQAYSSESFSVHHITLAPNVIYYLLEKDAIVVMAVVHTKRSPQYVNKLLRDFLDHYEH